MWGDVMLETVFLLFVSWLIIKLLPGKRDQEEEEEEPAEVLYTIQLHDSIDMLSHIDYQLQMIDDLICNIQNGCDSDVLHSVSLSWKWLAEEDSKSLEFPCYMYSREYLLSLCYARRSELIAHLSHEINNLPIRHGQNMDGTLLTTIHNNLDSREGECQNE